MTRDGTDEDRKRMGRRIGVGGEEFKNGEIARGVRFLVDNRRDWRLLANLVDCPALTGHEVVLSDWQQVIHRLYLDSCSAR